MLVGVGLISYPLYLWHWPLLSFFRTLGLSDERQEKVAAFLISIVLAWLTYRLIERPIRFGNHGAAKAVTLLAAMALVGSAGYYTYLRDGMEGSGYRTTEKSSYARHFENSPPEWKYYFRTGIYEKYREDCNFYDLPQYLVAGYATKVPRREISKSCYTRSNSYPNAVFLWGDSHAEQLNYGLRKHLPGSWQLLRVASAGCPAVEEVGGPSTSDYCLQSNWFAWQTIKELKPNVVLIAQARGHDSRTMVRIADKLRSVGVEKVIFAGPTPHWRAPLHTVVLRKLWPDTPRRTFLGID